MKYVPDKPALAGVELAALSELLTTWGEPGYRARQIMDWFYKKRVCAWEEMSNLPLSLRQKLADTFDMRPTERVLHKSSTDVTEKLLLRLRDGSLIETVIIRAPQEGVGLEHSRKTICISTQVGCAYGCKFCASGLAGWKRDLSAGEIVAQLLEVCWQEDSHSPKAAEGLASFDNIVVMGMGEPLANYDNLLAALRIINAEWGFHFGSRRITVSTSGLVPQIRRLAEEPLGVRLAVSLHGATDEVREQIMPINRRYPLSELLPAVRYFAEQHGRMVTLEYILIQEVNDALDQAGALAEIARDLHAHVNLIPYNRVEGLDWIRPSLNRQDKFVEILRRQRISVTIRREKGHDINAACGQLRLQAEREGSIAPVPARQ